MTFAEMDLNEAEQSLIAAAQVGEVCNLQVEDEEKDDPANGASWGPERTIQDEVIRMLCVGAIPDVQVDYRGVRLRGARITGNLNLNEATLHDPLWLNYCRLEGVVLLSNARTRTLSLDGSLMPASGGREFTILADGVEVGGNLQLRDGFNAKATVRLLGARVHGQLDCAGAKLSAGDKADNSLQADRVRVGNSVFLNLGFHSVGEVRLTGAKIEGQLNCDGGKFVKKCEEGVAMNLDGSVIGSDVNLIEGFESYGEVRLVGATIGGQLVCEESRLSNPGGTAFLMQGAEVRDEFVWMKIAPEVTGSVDFASARVRVLIDDESGWPSNDDRLILDGFEYERLASSAPLDAKRRLDWLERRRQDVAGFRPQPYEQLAAVYDRMGHDEDARKIRIAKRQAERKWGKLSKMRRLQNWLLECTIKYGWRPWRAIWIGLAIVAFGFGLFTWAHSNGAIRPSDNQQWNLVQAFVYSLDTFLPVVNLGPGGEFEPNLGAGAWGWIAQIYLWIHILFGWMVTSLGVLAFSGLVRQK